MEEITNQKQIEQLQWEEDCMQARLKEQKEKKDYSYLGNGTTEKCECGTEINANGHCPKCDY